MTRMTAYKKIRIISAEAWEGRRRGAGEAGVTSHRFSGLGIPGYLRLSRTRPGSPTSLSHVVIVSGVNRGRGAAPPGPGVSRLFKLRNTAMNWTRRAKDAGDFEY